MLTRFTLSIFVIGLSRQACAVARKRLAQAARAGLVTWVATLSPALHATNLTWAGTTGQHWSTNSSSSDTVWNSGGSNIAWISGSNAIFNGGTGGTVETVDIRHQNISVGDITFSSSSGAGYNILTTATYGLVLGGSSASTANTTTVSTAGVPVTISVVLSGTSANLTKTGGAP